MASFFFPAWMMDSSVYVNSLTMLMRSAASRVSARKPLVASVTWASSQTSALRARW